MNKQDDCVTLVMGRECCMQLMRIWSASARAVRSVSVLAATQVLLHDITAPIDQTVRPQL